MQSDDIHAPVFEVEKVSISKTVVGRKLVKVRVERVCFINSINSMKDLVSIVLIDKEWVIGIDSDTFGKKTDQEKDNYFEKYLVH